MNYRKLQHKIVDKYWNVENKKVDRVCQKLNRKIYGNLTANNNNKCIADLQYLYE